MKSLIGSLAFLAVIGLQIYLWGHFIVDIVMHPVRAFEVIVVPSLCICVIMWTFYWFANREKRERRRAEEQVEQIKARMQAKTTEELYEIVMSDNPNLWTETAVQAAKDQIRLRGYAFLGITAPPRTQMPG